MKVGFNAAELMAVGLPDVDGDGSAGGGGSDVGSGGGVGRSDGGTSSREVQPWSR